MKLLLNGSITPNRGYCLHVGSYGLIAAHWFLVHQSCRGKLCFFILIDLNNQCFHSLSHVAGVELHHDLLFYWKGCPCWSHDLLFVIKTGYFYVIWYWFTMIQKGKGKRKILQEKEELDCVSICLVLYSSFVTIRLTPMFSTMLFLRYYETHSYFSLTIWYLDHKWEKKDYRPPWWIHNNLLTR